MCGDGTDADGVVMQAVRHGARATADRELPPASRRWRNSPRAMCSPRRSASAAHCVFRSGSFSRLAINRSLGRERPACGRLGVPPRGHGWGWAGEPRVEPQACHIDLDCVRPRRAHGAGRVDSGRGVIAARCRVQAQRLRNRARPRWPLAGVPPLQGCNSISPGRQVLLNQGSSGPYRRRIMNQPLPGIVCTQLCSMPAGALGPK